MWWCYISQLPQQAKNHLSEWQGQQEGIDFLIDALLRIERDNFFSYMRRKQLFEINYREVQEEERHSRGMNIPPQRVQVCTITLEN